MGVGKIYVSSHSRKVKEQEYRINKEVFDRVALKSTKILKIPKPYCFMQDHNIFLREYIKEQTLKELIIDNGKPSSQICKLLASALVEFQSIDMPAEHLKNILT